jgi:signal transduction histidine kinase
MSDDRVRPTREETDLRLEIERGKTDDTLAKGADATEDTSEQVLNTERGRARREREERARILAGLLAYERESTDRSLLLERFDADEIVAKRDDFLGMVSHDLRNELGGITLGVSRLIQTVSDDDSGRKVFKTATTIQRSALRMNRLIADLLDVVSIEAGKFTVVAEEEDVSRIVDELIESLQVIASAKGILLDTKVIGAPISARCDHQRILQVLGNLVTNALKFTPQGGQVTVWAERKGDEIWCSVSDTGTGIAPDRMEALFERFSRGSRSDRSGLGLGLYIARRIIEAHGGRIWAESLVGRGSSFHFTLPSIRL